MTDKKKTSKQPPKPKTKLPPGIKQLDDGRYRLLVKLTDPRTKRVSYVERTLAPGATLGEAVDARAALVAEMRLGQAPTKKAAPPTLGAYARLWIASKARRVRSVTAESIASILTHRILPHLGDLPIAEIRRSDLEAYVGWLERDSGYAVSTQIETWSKLLSMLRDAWEEYDLRPIGRLKGPQGTAKPAGRALTRDEMDRLLEAAGRGSHKHASIVTLLAYTGLRSLEACMLRWVDLDLRDPDDAWLTVSHSKTKAGLGRRVPLPRVAVEALERHRATQPASPWVWCSATNPDDHVNHCMVRRAVVGSATLAGLSHMSPHDLRRTYITLMEQAGVNRLALRKLVGHSSNATTDGYVRLTASDLRGALTVLEGGRKSA